jgi:CheY-like chemotaxis protein
LTSKANTLGSINEEANKQVAITKILVVEDNLDAQAALCELLSLLDYQVVGVGTAEDAIKEIGNFDILLTDLNLPGMNGIELAKKIKSVNPNVPIIISSGMDISAELNFDVFTLPKPFTVSILNEILDKAKQLIESS